MKIICLQDNLILIKFNCLKAKHLHAARIHTTPPPPFLDAFDKFRKPAVIIVMSVRVEQLGY